MNEKFRKVYQGCLHMKSCPRCGHNIQEGQAKCPNCGVEFAQWYASHPSHPSRLSSQVSASIKFSPSYQKNIGLAILILCLVPFILDVRIYGLYILWIYWLISGIGLALYSKGSGRSYAWGLLALLPLIGHLIGLFAFARNKVGATEENAERGSIKAQSSSDNAVNQKKQFYITLASSVLLTLFLTKPHAGFMISIFAFPLSIWLIYNIYVVLTKPDRRKWQIIRMVVWVVSFMVVWMVVWMVHDKLKQTTRHDADDIVAAINRYKSEHGAYPDNIEMIGVSKKQLEEKLGRPSGYVYDKGKPNLYYADTFTIFQTYFYDFQKNTWVHHGD